MRIFCLLLPVLFSMACASDYEGVKKNPVKVEAIYTNAVIWTGEPNSTDASFMAVDKGVIRFVGDHLPEHLSTDHMIDLDGQFVMAGFMDNHVHFMEGGAALASVDLRNAKTQADFVNRILDYGHSLDEPGRWILNGNWDHTLWGGDLPRKDWLDAGTMDRPVYVIRIDGHMALANSAALKAAGITKDTPNPVGGVIMKDPSGEPTGVLKGNALTLVLNVIPAPSDDELMEQFSLAQDHALSLGLTKVHAVTAYPTETTMLSIFQMAQARGLLKLRAQVSTPIEAWQDMAISIKDGDRGNPLLKWGGVKGFIDGSLGARTAWLHKPYSDDPTNFGLPLNDPEQFLSWMQAADQAGLELTLHALGDRGIDYVIQSLQSIAGDAVAARRYRIEHFQHPTEAAIQTLAHLGIIASMQPYHAIDDGRWAEDRIGAERLKTTYAFRSILDAGGILTFGSDWPVAPLSPMLGVYAAVTRQTLDGRNPEGWVPEQKITVQEALTAYTQTNAYSFREETLAGTLSVGKRADFIVLSDDPRRVNPEDLRTLNISQTYIGGDLVYRRAPKP